MTGKYTVQHILTQIRNHLGFLQDNKQQSNPSSCAHCN